MIFVQTDQLPAASRTLAKVGAVASLRVIVVPRRG